MSMLLLSYKRRWRFSDKFRIVRLWEQKIKFNRKIFDISKKWHKYNLPTVINSQGR